MSKPLLVSQERECGSFRPSPYWDGFTLHWRPKKLGNQAKLLLLKSKIWTQGVYTRVGVKVWENAVGLMWRHFHVKFWRFALKKILLLVWGDNLEHECKAHCSQKVEVNPIQNYIIWFIIVQQLIKIKIWNYYYGSKNIDGIFVGVFFIHNFNRPCASNRNTIYVNV